MLYTRMLVVDCRSFLRLKFEMYKRRKGATLQPRPHLLQCLELEQEAVPAFPTTVQGRFYGGQWGAVAPNEKCGPKWPPILAQPP